MDLAAGPDRHWHEHRYERTADRTSAGSTPGTSHRRPGAGRAHFMRSCCSGGRSWPGAALAAIWLWTWVRPWAGGSSSARRGVRCGCRTPRSSGSAMRPSTPAGSARRCCSNHGRGRRAGEVSCPARSPGKWPCGSRNDDRRARSLDAARNGGQDAFARLVGPYLTQPRAYCHRMLRPHFAHDTERWIPGPAWITTTTAADPASQKGAAK